MKKLLVCLLLSLVAASAMCETSVWVARTDSTTTYIGGTVHLLRASDRPFPPEFDKAYDASGMLVFETDLVKLMSPETQQAILADATYKDGRTLDKVLTEEAYKKLDSACTSAGLPLAAMNQYKPSIVIVNLMSMELMKHGVDQEGIDVYYHTKALADEKPTAGLEPVEVQVRMLTSMGDGDESEFILYNLEDLAKTEQVFDSIVAAWKTGDVATLENEFVKELDEKFPKLYKMLLTDRNNSWVPEIEEYLTTPTTEFVLVGVAHLVGKDGVIEQLREHGYKVEQLK